MLKYDIDIDIDKQPYITSMNMLWDISTKLQLNISFPKAILIGKENITLEDVQSFKAVILEAIE